MRQQTLRSTWHAVCVGMLAIWALAGCASTPETHANYDTATDFAQYRTFGFFEKLGTDEDTGYESLITQQLKASTRRELEARGYRYTTNEPDLLVNFNTSVQQQVRVHSVPMPFYGGYWGGYYGYRYGYYGGWGGYEPWVDNYEEGTLNVDIVDARRKQLVWEGVTVGRITNQVKSNRSAAIDAAVKDLFAQYPFRAAGAQ